MRTPTSLIAAALTALTFAAPLAAQVQVMNPPIDEDRRGSNVIMFGDNVMAFVAVTWSAPQWKAEYDKPGVMDSFKGQNVRLGKNWWTQIDTNIPLEIGGQKLPVGSYFLGLHYTKDGEFHLMAFDTKMAMKNSLMPFMGDQWKGGTAIPLKLNKDKLDKTVEKMLIVIQADDKGDTGSFRIHWGKHELAADVKFMVAGAKNASADKDK